MAILMPFGQNAARWRTSLLLMEQLCITACFPFMPISKGARHFKKSEQGARNSFERSRLLQASERVWHWLKSLGCLFGKPILKQSLEWLQWGQNVLLKATFLFVYLLKSMELQGQSRNHFSFMEALYKYSLSTKSHRIMVAIISRKIKSQIYY